MKKMGEPSWFQVGDRDLALHLLRTQLIKQGGRTLTDATAEIAAKLGIRSTILPMTDHPIETRITTPTGEISFQEYFVRRHYQDKVLPCGFEVSKLPSGAWGDRCDSFGGDGAAGAKQSSYKYRTNSCGARHIATPASDSGFVAAISPSLAEPQSPGLLAP